MFICIPRGIMSNINPAPNNQSLEVIVVTAYSSQSRLPKVIGAPKVRNGNEKRKVFLSMHKLMHRNFLWMKLPKINETFCFPAHERDYWIRKNHSTSHTVVLSQQTNCNVHVMTSKHYSIVSPPAPGVVSKSEKQQHDHSTPQWWMHVKKDFSDEWIFYFHTFFKVSIFTSFTNLNKAKNKIDTE